MLKCLFYSSFLTFSLKTEKFFMLHTLSGQKKKSLFRLMFCSARTSSYFLNVGPFRLRRYCGTGNKPRLPRKIETVFGVVIRGTDSVDYIPLLVNGLD